MEADEGYPLIARQDHQRNVDNLRAAGQAVLDIQEEAERLKGVHPYLMLGSDHDEFIAALKAVEESVAKAVGVGEILFDKLTKSGLTAARDS